MCIQDKSIHKSILMLAGLAALCTAAPHANAGLITYQTIALTGTDGALGPNLGPGVQYFSIGTAVATLNNSGQALFRGQTNQTNNPYGVWRHSAGANTNVALAGGPQPGGGNYPATGIFNTPLIKSSGQTAWRLNTTTLFSDVGGGPGLVMANSAVAPGTGGATYGASGLTTPSPLMNNAGQTAYIASLTIGTGIPPVTASGATANASGLWIGTPGSTNLALRQNDPVSVLDPGGSIRVGAFTASSLVVNDSGAYSMVNSLQGSVTTGTASGNDQAVLTNRGGSLSVIARRGDQAPGAAAGEFYRSITNSGINNAGQVVFNSSLRNSAGTTVASGALFTDNSGSLTMTARAGNAMPTINGASPSEFLGVNWGSTFGATVINSAGKIAFTNSGLTGTGITIGVNDAAIFSLNSTGAFGKYMRIGDAAPVGLASDGSIIKYGGLQSGFEMNGSGVIAFTSLLTGFGVGGAFGNNSALFAAAPDGTVMAIARKGSPFEVAPGDIRTVTAFGGLGTSGGEDSRQWMLNDNNQLAFSLDFSDGSSGVFLANVPEPATFGVMAMGALMFIRRKTRFN